MAGEDLRAFRKGHISNKNPYQDVTFLTFQLTFDINSPLFNKEIAVKSLREQYNDEVRATKLESFIDTIIMINKEMPWYWTEISGVDRAFDYNMTKPYWGGDDAKLEISCNESINLAITGLMDMYKEAVYDLKAWTQVLPDNYKWFDMHVIVSEVRTIKDVKKTKGDLEQSINEDIVGDNQPKFMFTFKKCQFMMDSAKETFSSLSSAAPSQPSPKIRIKYEQIVKTAATYLNGISTVQVDDKFAVNNNTNLNSTNAFDDARATTADGIKGFNRKSNTYGSAFDKAFQRAVSEVDDIAGGLGNLGDNILKDAVAGITREGQGLITSLKANVYGLDRSATLGAALRQGAINSIFPLINNKGDNDKNDLGNTFGK